MQYDIKQVNKNIEISSSIKNQNHFLSFLLSELGTTGTIDNELIIIRGRFDIKMIENICLKYKEMYVICSECKSLDTNIVKEKRHFFLQCNVCSLKNQVIN